jgi:DNA-binding GntR family transcriptional regulator
VAGGEKLGVTIDRRSTVSAVAESLRDAILVGKIAPGTPLREMSLSAELGVSRNSIREAARVLASEGLVNHFMNRGMVVADVTDADVDDIYRAREAIEIAAIEALFASRDPEVYASLRELVAGLEDAFAAGDVSRALENDRLFHMTLVSATCSRRLERYFAALQQELRLALTLAERSRAELGRTQDDHRALRVALEGDSLERACRAMRDHLATGAAELKRLRELVRPTS